MTASHPGGHPYIIVLCLGTKVSTEVPLCACTRWPPKMDRVAVFLQDIHLTTYVDAFKEQGYTSLDQILQMNNEQLEELSDKTCMFGNDFDCFVEKVKAQKNCAPVLPTVSTMPTVPLIPQDGSNSPNTVGVLQRTGLQTSYKTTKEVRLNSLAHSTKLGCAAHLDYKKSGSRTKIFRCKSVKCTKKRPRDGAPPPPETEGVPCGHKLHWSFKKKTSQWELNLSKSELLHHPCCALTNGGQKVSGLELQHDTAFIKHIRDAKKVSGKSALKAAMGGTGQRLLGSVAMRTARRAINHVKKSTDKDYSEDWSKLHAWGREFQKLNPGSRFEVKRDEDGRLVPRSAPKCPECPDVRSVPKCSDLCPECPVVPRCAPMCPGFNDVSYPSRMLYTWRTAQA